MELREVLFQQYHRTALLNTSWKIEGFSAPWASAMDTGARIPRPVSYQCDEVFDGPTKTAGYWFSTLVPTAQDKSAMALVKARSGNKGISRPHIPIMSPAALHLHSQSSSQKVSQGGTVG
jgi:hypothetical protein